MLKTTIYISQEFLDNSGILEKQYYHECWHFINVENSKVMTCMTDLPLSTAGTLSINYLQP